LSDDGGGGGSESLFTPPPGSPGAIRAGASSLTSRAEQVSELAASARKAQSGLVGDGHWSGPAASAFTGFAGRTESLVATTEQPLASVAKAAGTYADALQTAQHQIREAKHRYDAARAKAQHEATAVNSDPHATQADVTAAQGRVDAANDDAAQAEADALKAWARYNSACHDAARTASSATSEMAEEVDGSPLAKVLEGSEPYREWNDQFHSVWDLVYADKGLEALVEASKTRLAGLADIARGIAEDRTLWSSQLSAFERLAEIGEATPDNLAEASSLAQRLDALEAFGGGAAADAGRAGALFQGLRGLSKGVGVTAVLGDALTIIDPPDKGVMGNVDRGVAGVNGALVAANLFTDEIPVVGEVTIAVTGAYLAGNYLYHHWGAFHDACDTVAHSTVAAAQWTGHEVSQAATGVAHAAENVASDVSDAASGVGHAASGAWHSATSWL